MKDLLNTMYTPEDIKALSQSELKQLAKELRRFLVREVAKTGGHLASNLGVVELTLALHFVFSLPEDKIVWDVGHQAYVHKILTGRRERFSTLRQEGGISGFPKPCESPYDAFAAGHSSTSVSAALGMAKARDLLGKNNAVIAVIGDGAMTGGLVYEAMNNAGRENTNLIVILNDNQMSISPNVGALSRHLSQLRTGQSYQHAKRRVQGFLERIPGVGKAGSLLIRKIKTGVKYFVLPGVLFEEMGFHYIGPVDGHDLDTLIPMLENTKSITGPVLIHMKTKKGKGYPPAEQNPAEFHGIGAFSPGTGIALKKSTAPDYSKVFGDILTALAKKHPQVVAITAAMASGTGLESFAERFPKRFFDVGIAEQHAVTFAAGLAAEEMIPVFAVYSTFLQRAYDQIVHDVCLQNLHVIFAIDRAGVVGADGETHQGVFDLSFLTHVPNITVLSPKNGWELTEMLTFAVSHHGPIAIRYPRGIASQAFAEHCAPIELGKAEVIREGRGIALLAEGHMLEAAEEAASLLRIAGETPMLVNMRFLKPLDTALLDRVAKNCHLIVTVEDNVKRGGFGSFVLEYFSEKGYDTRVLNLGYPDVFIPHATQTQIYQKYSLDGAGIYRTIQKCQEETEGERNGGERTAG